MITPTWIQTSPMDYLQAMEEGSRTGLQERQIGDSERENFQRNALAQQELEARQQQQQQEMMLRRAAAQQQGQEFQAGQSLQRDKLVADTALTARQQQQGAQRQAAADELRQAQLLQASLLGQGRLAAENARIGNEDAFHQGDLDNQSAANALRQKAQDWKENHPTETASDFATVKDKDSGTTIKVPTKNYADYVAALEKWQASAPPETIKVPGKMWGQNDVPNPALAVYLKSKPKITDFLQTGQPSAAAGLTPPTDGTGTSGLPDLTGVPVPSTPTPLPNTPATSTATTPTFTKGEQVKQGGVVYEFDGQNWNPVNQ